MNLEEYEREHIAQYREFCHMVRGILEKAIMAAGLPHPQSMQCREKDPRKLRARLEELGALDSDSIETLRRDIAGARLIFYTNTDVDRFIGSRLIFNNFEVEEDGIKIHHPTKENAEDQYRGIHYTVRLKENRTNLPEYEKFKGLRCEVQVQTILHHAWSETSHDILYKTEPREGFGGRAMETIKNRFNRIMNKHLLPAGYEFQRIQHDYERLQQGKELFDRDLLTRLELAVDNNERHEIFTSLKQDVLPNYDDIGAIYGDVLPAMVAAAKKARETPTKSITTPFGEFEGKTEADVAMLVVETIETFRYRQRPAVKALDEDSWAGRNYDGEKLPFHRFAPNGEFLEPDQADATCPVLREKINRFAFCPNHIHKPRRPVPLNEGRFAIVTDVGAGCGGRFGAFDEWRVRRTAKSCGPDAPTLASSWRRCFALRGDGGKRARSPRRARRKPLKPFACGNAG